MLYNILNMCCMDMQNLFVRLNPYSFIVLLNTDC